MFDFNIKIILGLNYYTYYTLLSTVRVLKITHFRYYVLWRGWCFRCEGKIQALFLDAGQQQKYPS